MVGTPVVHPSRVSRYFLCYTICQLARSIAAPNVRNLVPIKHAIYNLKGRPSLELQDGGRKARTAFFDVNVSWSELGIEIHRRSNRHADQRVSPLYRSTFLSIVYTSSIKKEKELVAFRDATRDMTFLKKASWSSDFRLLEPLFLSRIRYWLCALELRATTVNWQDISWSKCIR